MNVNNPSDQSSNLHNKDEVEAKSEEVQDLEIQQFTRQDLDNVEANYGETTGSVMSGSLSRALSRRMNGVEDLYREASNSKEPLPKMGGGKDYPPMLSDRDPYAVAYNGPDDPEFPYNWSVSVKLLNSFAVALCALSSSMGSAMFSQASAQLVKEFHIGEVVAALGTSLFVFGFAAGPIVWGPLSELYGRRPVMSVSLFIYICFCFAVATGKDVQTIMICRFFAGFTGAASLVVAPAAMSDIFESSTRGKAVTVFSMAVFGGPMLAPILGGFIVKNPHMG